jgi:GntR family transcriptional regulator
LLPFSIAIQSGTSVTDQVVYAVTRAIVAGQLEPGDRFPSVRALSQELRVNPNTAQRIVSLLVEQKLLEVRPGIGTLVAPLENGTRQQRTALGSQLAEPLVVEAKRLGLGLADLLEIVREQWRRVERSR